jgi:CRP-like cAMP-binding protein
MPLTQQDIANHVGASRRAVARAMAILRERQIVTTEGRRIVVANREVLALFANAGGPDAAGW